MIYDSFYWISATALEPINNYEIVVLEKNINGEFTIRHAKNVNDWLTNQAAYVDVPSKIDDYGNLVNVDIQSGDLCRCLIVNVSMK